MDFSSLGQGSPFYILRQGEKPILEVGTVKSKTQPHVKFPTQTPNLMTGLQTQQVIDVTATINGKGSSADIAGDLKVIAGNAAIGGSISSSYRLYVYGTGRFNYLVVGNASTAGTVSCATVETEGGRGLYLKTATGLPVYANGSYSNQSDIRLKNIVSYVGGSAEDIANAPIFNFQWIGTEIPNVILGTSAQYWQKYLPTAVSIAPNGYLSMDYSSVALAAAVITARRVVSHEGRIAALEAENKKLREELNRLKAA